MSEITRKRFEEKKVPEKLPHWRKRTPEELERQIEEARKEEERLRQEIQRETERLIEEIKKTFDALIRDEVSDMVKYGGLAEKYMSFPTFSGVMKELALDEKRHAKKLRDILWEIKRQVRRQIRSR